VRRLGDYFRRRHPGDNDAPGARVADERETGSRRRGRRASDQDLEALRREVEGVARYVARLKREIGALRPNEIYRDRLPMAHGDLASIKETTASSVNEIMSAAEAILTSPQTTYEAYRQDVEAKVMLIFEACSFQDLTGQRVARVDDLVGQMEKRLQRFALAVKAADSTVLYDREAIMQEARRELLIVQGPQNATVAVTQSAVDKLFD
jgi:chemotaxis protein CheZ